MPESKMASDTCTIDKKQIGKKTERREIMLANLKDVLVPAKKEHYGVGLFNTVNLEMAFSFLPFQNGRADARPFRILC